MRRTIRSWRGEAIAPVQWLDPLPEQVRFPLSVEINRCAVAPVVRASAEVSLGEIVAQGEALCLHASVPGRVERADAEEIVIRRGPPSSVRSRSAPARLTGAEALAVMAREMGLVGMGGSLFPASVKLGAARRIHSLIINAVECEPGVQIDEALLLYETDTVRAGMDCVTSALDIPRRVLAVKRASVRRVQPLLAACEAEVLAMPNRYPAGAEKLIVGRLERRMPPAGVLPVQLGYLVLSVASLWALGRWHLHGEPSILRPLSLVVSHNPTRNLFVPVGTPVSHLLHAQGVEFDAEKHLMVTGGLMMGMRATPETPILKGTNAVFVQPVPPRLLRAEAPCILCGACFDACPLNLHPSGMMERIKSGKRSAALTAQLNECFLCGACAAVCPSDIPLAHYFREAKRTRRP